MVSAAPDGPTTTPDAPVLTAKLPGALMYRREMRHGIPDFHSTRSRHVHTVRAGATFSTFDQEERDALFSSLAKTVRRAEYHRQRFVLLRAELDRRRDDLPGEVTYDEYVEPLHYELQAFCGAARMTLDEIVYVVARRHGVQPKAARRKPWETSDLLKKAMTPPPQCLVDEIKFLRTKDTFFDLLNAYRNTFFHHGWQHAFGHFDPSDGRSSAKTADTNGLLVPDMSSLVGRSKPSEWTYLEGRTIDDVYRGVNEGFDTTLKELFENYWATPEPKPGTKPRSEHPNIMVRLISPRVLIFGNRVIVPIFSTRDGAANREPFNERDENELVEVPVVTSVVGRRAVTFSLRGLTRDDVPLSVKTFDVLVDPVFTPDMAFVDSRQSITLDLEPFLSTSFPHVDVLIVVDETKSVFMWQRKPEPLKLK